MCIATSRGLILLAICSFTSATIAQQPLPGCALPLGQPACGVGGYGGGPGTPGGACCSTCGGQGQCRPGCPNCQPPCAPPCEERTPRDFPQQPDYGPRDMPPPETPYVPRETGQYVAPPRTGSAIGPTNRVGIEGGSITLPELRLKLPSFELPSCFRSRQGARMRVDAAEAPWVSNGYENVYADRNEAVLQQEVARLRSELQNTPRDAREQRDERSARDAAERHLDECRKELESLRCEVDRLRQLEAAIDRAKRNYDSDPTCRTNRPGQPTPAYGNGDVPVIPVPTPTMDEARRRQLYPAHPIEPQPLQRPVYQPVTAPYQERAAAYQPQPAPVPAPQPMIPPPATAVQPIFYAAPLAPPAGYQPAPRETQQPVIRQPAPPPAAQAPIRQPASAPQGRIVGIQPRG